MGGQNLCISRCENSQNETELLIRKVVDIQQRGSLEGTVLGGLH